MTKLDFSEVKNAMDKAVAECGVPGSDIAVSCKGEIVYRYWNGTKDDQRSVNMQGDELYFLYSATKPITCTAALQLYERGKIGLEDRVSDYIPSFKDMYVKSANGLKKAENPIRIKHLFTMTSGLNYDLESKSIVKQKNLKNNASTLEMVKAIAKEPLEFEPGEHFLYSLGHDVLAAIVEIVSDTSYEEYLKKHIFEVCGMKNTGFYLNDEIREKMCSQYMWDEENKRSYLLGKENPFILTPSYQSGGAGLISCVDDYIKFVTEMANGNRLLKKETIDLMRQNHLEGHAYEDFKAYKKGYAYGLGVRTDSVGMHVAKGEFGWDGAAGSYVMIDPDNHVGIFYATHIRKHGEYLYENLHPTIRNAVYRELRKNSVIN